MSALSREGPLYHLVMSLNHVELRAFWIKSSFCCTLLQPRLQSLQPSYRPMRSMINEGEYL